MFAALRIAGVVTFAVAKARYRCGELPFTGWVSHPLDDSSEFHGLRIHSFRTSLAWSHRPLTTESSMEGGAISTTRRRSTTRPCNLSRAVTQPASLRCALSPARGTEVRPRAPHRATSQILTSAEPGSQVASRTIERNAAG